MRSELHSSVSHTPLDPLALRLSSLSCSLMLRRNCVKGSWELLAIRYMYPRGSYRSRSSNSRVPVREASKRNETVKETSENFESLNTCPLLEFLLLFFLSISLSFYLSHIHTYTARYVAQLLMWRRRHGYKPVRLLFALPDVIWITQNAGGLTSIRTGSLLDSRSKGPRNSVIILRVLAQAAGTDRETSERAGPFENTSDI